MNQKYEAPVYAKKAFHCPRCGVYSNFNWKQVYHGGGGRITEVPMQTALCSHCNQLTYWISSSETSGKMVDPIIMAAPTPHEDLPAACRSDYEEARSVSPHSSRAAAALLRLCLQKLCVTLGESGKNINDDIGALVAKGLPVEIQQALDIVRVSGNNAVHPGEMSLEDNPEIVGTLFGMINLVVDNRISQPKRIAKLFGALPEGARAAIEKRDGKRS